MQNGIYLSISISLPSSATGIPEFWQEGGTNVESDPFSIVFSIYLSATGSRWGTNWSGSFWKPGAEAELIPKQRGAERTHTDLLKFLFQFLPNSCQNSASFFVNALLLLISEIDKLWVLFCVRVRTRRILISIKGLSLYVMVLDDGYVLIFFRITSQFHRSYIFFLFYPHAWYKFYLNFDVFFFHNISLASSNNKLCTELRLIWRYQHHLYPHKYCVNIFFLFKRKRKINKWVGILDTERLHTIVAGVIRHSKSGSVGWVTDKWDPGWA